MPLKDDVHEFLDNHIKEAKYVVLGLGVIGGVLVARDLHLASRFCHISQIPAKFLTNHVTLQGIVSSVSTQGALSVRHLPIVTVPFSNWIHTTFCDTQESGELTIKLAGVEMSVPALEWLTYSAATQQHIWFQMMFTKDDAVFCSVYAKKNILFKTSWNEVLVGKGLAYVCRDDFTLPPHDDVRDKLLYRLAKLETRAREKKIGLWADEVPDSRGDKPSMVSKIGTGLKNLFSKKRR